jgi:hypothetical protein
MMLYQEDGMTLFDERERAFENLFAHEEEMRFRALSRRNDFFARWAAEQLDLRRSERQAYIRSFVDAVVRPQSDEALIGRVRADFIAEGVDASDQRIRAALATATVEAARQVRTETRAERSEFA